MATAMAPPWSWPDLSMRPLRGVVSVIVLSSWRDLQWGGVVIVIIVHNIRVIFTMEYSPFALALHQKQIFLNCCSWVIWGCGDPGCCHFCSSCVLEFMAPGVSLQLIPDGNNAS
jgi:hypothetical protein